MMQQTRLKYLALSFIVLIGSTANGQEFRHSATLDTIPGSGFYAVHLNSELLSYLRTDLADLRIEDKNNRQVPYLIQSTGKPLYTSFLVEFPILSNRIIDSGETEIILSNDSAKWTYNIKLFIKNAAVSRLGSLSGSNDRQKWFIIDDQVLIGRSYESIKDEYLQEIAFPASTYRFYKLVIDNQKNDPMNIVRAGSYSFLYERSIPQFENNPVPTITQTDSGKYQIVNVQYTRPYHISRITILTSGAKFFNREFQLFAIDSAMGTKNYIGSFSLNSKTAPFFDFPLVKTSRLQLIIDNRDNPPLAIDQVVTEHLSINATAFLEKNDSYRLLMDNAEANLPDYDLVNFKDSIPQSIGYLNPQKIVANETVAKDSKNRKWWIWPVLIGVIAIMGLLTYKLSGDVKFNVKS